MNYTKLLYDGQFYSRKGATSSEMGILGRFLTSDVGCRRQLQPSYQDWALDDSRGLCVSGNITYLEKEGNYIVLSDLDSEEKKPTTLRISRAQFVQLLDDWQEKVCKHKPQEVIITNKNDQFIIETKISVDVPKYKGINNIRQERFDCDFFLYSPEQAIQKISNIIGAPRQEVTEIIFNVFQDNEKFIDILTNKFEEIWKPIKSFAKIIILYKLHSYITGLSNILCKWIFLYSHESLITFRQNVVS